MMWVNDGLPLVVNSLITEYDIRSGNTSIMKHFHLIPEETIREIEALPKKERVIRVGLLMKNDPNFSKQLEGGFNAAVKEFLERNELDIDVDVLTVKRDAVFVVNHPVVTTQIGDSITFVAKNVYHAALQVGKYEFYFKSDGTIDIKGFIQSDKDTNGALEKLKPGMLSFLNEFVEVAESCNMDRKVLYEWVRTALTAYKDRQLDPEYYREFTRDALFKVNIDGSSSYMDFISDDMIDDLDITHNYLEIIIPLMQILI